MKHLARDLEKEKKIDGGLHQHIFLERMCQVASTGIFQQFERGADSLIEGALTWLSQWNVR